MLPADGKSKPQKGAEQPDQKLFRYFTREEIRLILANCSEHRKSDIYFLVKFLWCTGIRVSEAIALKAKDVNLDTRLVRVQSLRRRDGHIRNIPIKSDFAAEIAEWIQSRQLTAEDRLFPVTRKTAYNWVVWACRQSDFHDGRANPQVFRHSFAVNLLVQGIPVSLVQECLGHRDLSETLAYTKMIDCNPLRLFEFLEF